MLLLFIFAKSTHIYRETGIRLEEDFPEDIEKNRKLLKPILKAASSMHVNGKQKYQASLRLDKLRVNGRTYTKDNMNTLPADIHPTIVATPTKNNITAFFGGQSPFSNHYLAEQKVDNVVYNTNEQYYMYQKAKRFNDHETAAKILKEKDPVIQKKLGNIYNIKGYNEGVWRQSCLEIMEQGLKAKIDQNPDIKKFLLDTGTNMLLEASPSDRYWGIGMSINYGRTWIKNSWSGTADNHLGRLLAELRSFYRR